MNEYDSNRISNLAKEAGYIKTDNINNGNRTIHSFFK